MKIQYLREFVMLAHLLNFGKAAKKLYLTQPVLSRHIMALENEIGSTLFVRNTQNVHLTEDGRIFLREIEQIVKRYDATIERLHSKTKGGSLGIGMLYYSKELLIPALNLFRESFPDVHLHFLSKTPGEIVNALMADEIDVGNLLRVQFECSDQFHFKDIYQEPMILMVNSTHRFAARKSVSVKELIDERFVNVSDIFFKGYFNYIRGKLRIHDVEIDPEPYLVQDYESLLLAVQSGTGIAILSHNMKKQKIPCSTYVDLEESDIVIRRCLAYKTSNNNPTVPHFMRLFSYLEYPVGYENRSV